MKSNQFNDGYQNSIFEKYIQFSPEQLIKKNLIYFSILGEKNLSPHAINAAASNHFSISLTTTCLILYGLNFTQTHYWLSHRISHTIQGHHCLHKQHIITLPRVRSVSNLIMMAVGYYVRWWCRKEDSPPLRKQGHCICASHLRADRDSDHDISRPQLCHLAVTPGYVTHASLTSCQRGWLIK